MSNAFCGKKGCNCLHPIWICLYNNGFIHFVLVKFYDVATEHTQRSPVAQIIVPYIRKVIIKKGSGLVLVIKAHQHLLK